MINGDLVSMAHTIDDLTRANAALMRAINDHLPLLEDARHALANGSPEVTDEYLDRTIGALTDARSKARRITEPTDLVERSLRRLDNPSRPEEATA